jgi:sialate O-acetylesterase
MVRYILPVFILALAARADIRLPNVLADHMVVQRGLPVHVWGMAAPAESVSVSFRGESRSAAADELGRWSVYLGPGEAGGPFELTVRGNSTIVLRDVLVGDVWVASGQSNMEWPLERAINGQEEVAQAKYPRMRLYHVKNKSSIYPLDDTAADTWAECTPESAAKFSAVAYFFGRDLFKNGIPVGLISTSWGGTPADAWTSLGALSADAALMPAFASWAAMANDQPAVLLRREKQHEEAVRKARAEGKPEPAAPWSPNQENSWMPAGLFNGMIAPLTKFPIKGAIWYQGESNADAQRSRLYERLFGAMIRDWRRAWGQGDFPFLFVQLANFKTGPGSMWPELREAQRKTLELVNTGMAVTIDIGTPEDIHPRNKQDVGRRLALAARAVAYGEQVEYSGPAVKVARPEAGAMRVWFDHAAGLMVKGGAPQCFEIAGADKKYAAADARIEGETVVARSSAVADPRSIRYAWSDNPACNLLFNSSGLPASPFRAGE